jgi:hypothetical protein
LTLSNFEDLIYQNKSVELPKKPELECILNVNYIFLDNNQKMAQKNNEYLITQNQYFGDLIVDENKDINTFDLHFYGLVYQIIFTLHKNLDEPYNCGYSTEEDDPLIWAELSLNGYTRWRHDALYLRTIDKKESGINIPKIPVYTYSFGLHLNDEINPSGSANFSKINKVTLKIKTKPGVKGLRIWAKSHNLLLLQNGYAGLRYVH